MNEKNCWRCGKVIRREFTQCDECLRDICAKLWPHIPPINLERIKAARIKDQTDPMTYAEYAAAIATLAQAGSKR